MMHNPMHEARAALAQHPRCGAQSRTTGQPCRNPSMANGRCRMHGGNAPGAAKGNRNALKHGRYTAQAIGERRDLIALLRDMRGLVEQVDGEG